MTPLGAPEERSSGPASTPESPPPPPQTASPTPVGHGQSRVEPPEDCCVCYETLAAPMVHLRTCPHRLHVPCFRCPPRQSGDRRTLPCMKSHRNSSRTSRQKSTPTAQQRGYGRGDGSRMTRDAGWGRRRVIHQVHKGREGRESDKQHLPRFGGGDGLRANVLLLRGALPLHLWLR